MRKSWKSQLPDRSVLFWLMPLLLGVLTFPEFDPEIPVGLDGSYMWAFNELFAHQFKSLQYLIFPHGPLGFVLFPLPIGYNWWLAISLIGTLHFLLAILLWELRMKHGLIPKIIMTIWILLILANYKTEHLPVFIVLSCVALYLQQPNKKWIVLAILIAIPALFIKATTVLSILSIFSVLTIIFLLRKEWNPLVTFTVPILVFSYTLIWLLSFGTLASLVPYWQGQFALISGHSGAMVLDAENNWLYLFAAWSLMLVLLYTWGFKKKGVILWITMPFFFLSWKHGIVRQDYSHYMHFWFAWLGALGIVVLTTKNKFRSVFGVSLIVLFCTYQNLSEFTYQKPELFSSVGFQNFRKAFQKPACSNDWKLYYPGYAKEKYEIADLWIPRLREWTVDAVPHDLHYIAFNELNWQYRPSLQSYINYQPYIHKRELDHWQSNNAPRYILWHYEDSEFPYQSFDDRYLLQNQSYNWLQIMANYEMAELDSFLSVWRKMRSPKQIQLLPSGWIEKRVEEGQWIEIPETRPNILLGTFDLKRPLLERLRSFLFRPKPIYMEIYTRNNQFFRHRFVPGNAKSGIWLSPYLLDHETTLQTARIRLSGDGSPFHYSLQMKAYTFQ